MAGYRRCWFCAHQQSPLTDEHVLARTHFGAELVSPKAICESCNSASGEVELLVAGGAWVSEATAEFRTGTVPRPRAYPQVQGRTADGAAVHVEERPEGIKVVALTPRQVDTDPDGTSVWEVEAGTEAEFEARQLRRGESVRAIGRDLDNLRVTETQRGIGTRTFDAWGRFVSKVILATGSLVLPDSWLDTPDAANLRAFFLRQPHPDRATGLPLHPHEQPRDKEPWSLLNGTHLISLHRSPEGEGTQFLLALYGYLGAQIGLPETACPDDEPSWLIPSDFSAPIRVVGREVDDVIRERAKPESTDSP